MPTILKDKNRDRLPDGSGAALDPTTRTGADQEIAYNLLDHVFLLEMITLWIHLLSSAKLQMTKNMRNTIRQVNALNVENKVTLFVIVPTKRHVLV